MRVLATMILAVPVTKPAIAQIYFGGLQTGGDNFGNGMYYGGLNAGGIQVDAPVDQSTSVSKEPDSTEKKAALRKYLGTENLVQDVILKSKISGSDPTYIVTISLGDDQSFERLESFKVAQGMDGITFSYLIDRIARLLVIDDIKGDLKLGFSVKPNRSILDYQGPRTLYSVKLTDFMKNGIGFKFSSPTYAGVVTLRPRTSSP